MILYDYRCEGDHRFEAAVASMSSPAPDCPDCGSSARRVLTTVRTSGFASAGHSREDMPKSWKGMGNGNRDAVDYWRRSMEKRERLEERHPELGGGPPSSGPSVTAAGSGTTAGGSGTR